MPRQRHLLVRSLGLSWSLTGIERPIPNSLFGACHSVQGEPDFISPAEAQWLGLRGELEARLAYTEHCYLQRLDPREAQTEDAAVWDICGATSAYNHEESSSRDECLSEILSPAFHVPHSHMDSQACGRRDAAGGAARETSSGAESSLVKPSCLRRSDVQRRSVFHVHFSEQVCLACFHEQASCSERIEFGSMPLGQWHEGGGQVTRFCTNLASLSQPVHPESSTAQSFLPAARCRQVHEVSRLPAAFQHVPPLGASTAPLPQPPASPLAPLSAPTEFKIGSSSSLAPWEVPILPEDLNQPPARDQCVSRFPWFVGFRAAGGVTCTSQQYRYALFSVDRQAEVRELGLGWGLTDVAQDVLRVIPDLRNIRVLMCRLAGFPALQVVATSSTVPLPGHAYPLDLRTVGGRVCTVVLFPGMTHGEVDDRISRECQDFRRPDRPFSLRLPDGRPFRAIPFQVLGPDFIKGEATETAEVAVEIDETDLLQLSLHRVCASDGCKGPAPLNGPALHLTLPAHQGLPARPKCAQPHGVDMAAASVPLFSTADIMKLACIQSVRKPTEGLPAQLLPGLTGISCPAGPATKPSTARTAPCLISDLRTTISAQVPLRPTWMAGQQFSPPMDYACVATPPPAQSSRRFYTIFEPRLDHRQRSAPREWRLIDFITDAIREVQERVRLVYLITRPMHGFAAPQLALTLARAPVGCRSVPIDLRAVGGLVHTVEVFFPSPAVSIWEVLHDKGLDATGEWAAAHAAGHLYLLDQDGREIVAWADTDDGPEWAEFAARPGPWQARRIPYGSETAPPLQATFTTTTSTTTGMAVDQAEAALPPSLLGARLFSASAASCNAEVVMPFQVFPEHLSQACVRGLPAAQLHLYQDQGLSAQGRDFIVFGNEGTGVVRQASADWTVEQFLQEAVEVSNSAIRSVRFLSLPLPGLPTPQLTVTAQSADLGHVMLPIDARDIGGGIITMLVGPDASSHDLFATLLQAAPELTGTLHELLAVDGIFLQNEVGQGWEQSPPDLTLSQWVAVRRDHRLLQRLHGPLPPVLSDATTSTTTAVAVPPATEPSVVFVLVGGGTLLRLAPQRLSQLNLAASLTDLLMLLAIHGRLPSEPVVTVAAAMPRAASTPNTLYVGFVVVDLPDVDREVAVLQDQSLDGSLLVGLTVDRGTQAEGLLAPAQARRGFTAALNGAPMQGSRRSLVTGDLIQLHQGPLAARVWSATYLFQVLPELPLFALPTRLPGLRSFVRGDMSFDSRWNTRNYLFEAIGLRLLEQCLELGEPGARSHPYLVLGQAHLPLLLYVPSDDAPSQEQVLRFLFYSGFFDPGTTFAITAATSGTVPIVVSIPPRAHLMTVLFPAPDETPTMLQLSVDADCRLDSLQLPIRRGMELVFPRLTHAAVIQERHSTGATSSSRGGGSMSLLQVKTTILTARTTHGAVNRESLLRGLVSSPETEGASLLQVKVHPAQPRTAGTGAASSASSLGPVVAPSIPTPFGRRHLPSVQGTVGCNSLGQGPTCAPQPCCLALDDLLAKPAAAITWGVNQDICDACFADHQLPGFLEQAHATHIPECAALRQWRSLPDWLPMQPCDELFLFTDGSYSPGASDAAWAVVIIARQGGRIGKIGVRAGLTQGPGAGGAAARPVLSAFDGELEAALHALAFAAGVVCPLIQIGIDCAAALEVIQGQVALQPQDVAAHAAVAIRALLMMQGKTVLAHKVLAHAGCALNGLADAAAKAALRQAQPAEDDFSAFWEAVDEGIIAKLWLVPRHPLTAHTMPHLNEAGTWTRASCDIKCPEVPSRPFGTHPPTMPCQPVCLSLRILQYNALSLKGAGAMDLIAKGLDKHRVDVAGLQETRLSLEGLTSQGAFWVLHAPCSKQGTGGAQIWVRKSKKWDRQAFAIIHKEPQILLVTGVYKGNRVLLATAHALPACSADAELQEWWGHFDTVLHKSPATCTPIFMLDANATFAGGATTADTLQCRPVCGNSTRLLALTQRRGLALSPQQSPHGEQLFSWTSPQGHRKLIDYVAWPHDWANHGLSHPGVLLGDLHEDIDHQPVCIDLRVDLEAPPQTGRNRLDARLWMDPELRSPLPWQP